MQKSYGSVPTSSDDNNNAPPPRGGEREDDEGSSSSGGGGASSSSSCSDPETSLREQRRAGHHLSIREKAELYDEHAAAVDRIGELLALADNEVTAAAALGEALGEDADVDEEKATAISQAADALLRISLRLPSAAAGGPHGTPPLEMDAVRHPSLRASGRGTKRIPTILRKSSSGSIMYGEWPSEEELKPRSVLCKVVTMVSIGAAAIVGIVALFALGEVVVGPPNQPVGSYRLVELQEGEKFFDYYNFYAGPDSVGSNGYITYVSRERANELGIARVAREPVPADEMPNATVDDDGIDAVGGGGVGVTTEAEDGDLGAAATDDARAAPARMSKRKRQQQQQNWSVDGTETFVYLSSAPTEEGPRESIRLEGKRRFNRGLFVMDLSHMPAGCGAWPAFWLTDEANWPVNGEIDIVEGISYQSEAKTALHSTKGCTMDDVPNGVKTGTWDTAVGIPDKKTGKPDMTFRYATDCFVYDPHQWINQGCVAVDLEGGTLGGPLNNKGGGVYVLEWDPINRHIRTWVYTPHRRVPKNLMDSIRTAGGEAAERIAPNPDEWGLPYGYFPIGEETSCPTGHFRNMRLVINLAFCGSVAGNRYFLDCPRQFKKYKTCNEWVKSNPKELEEAYWKIRGVYVYEREWERKWV